jgi:hypothetical protein
MAMRNRERGVTFLGWLFLLTPMALVLYAGIRLTPIYLEYMKIARTLEQVSEEFKGEQPDVMQLRNAVERRFDVESVTVLNVRDANDVRIRKEGSGHVLEVNYIDTAPFMGNVSLQVEFKKVVKVE